MRRDATRCDATLLFAARLDSPQTRGSSPSLRRASSGTGSHRTGPPLHRRDTEASRGRSRSRWLSRTGCTASPPTCREADASSQSAPQRRTRERAVHRGDGTISSQTNESRQRAATTTTRGRVTLSRASARLFFLQRKSSGGGKGVWRLSLWDAAGALAPVRAVAVSTCEIRARCRVSARDVRKQHREYQIHMALRPPPPCGFHHRINTRRLIRAPITPRLTLPKRARQEAGGRHVGGQEGHGASV